MTSEHAPATGFGAALQRYRSARRMSQLDLAGACEVSARHLSFLESGRARPSRDMVLRLGAGLLLPLSVRNALLREAGFAPAFPSSQLNSGAVEPFRAILNEMVAKHAPNPAMLVDRHWSVREMNASAHALLSPLQGGGSESNVVRLITSREAERIIVNLPEVLAEMTARLQLESLEAGLDEEFTELLALLERASARRPHREAPEGRPVLPLIIKHGAHELRFLTAIAHFGTSEDANIRDLRLELLFPADELTRRHIANWS